MTGDSKVMSRITTIIFRREDFLLFKDLFRRIIWRMVLSREPGKLVDWFFKF